MMRARWRLLLRLRASSCSCLLMWWCPPRLTSRASCAPWHCAPGVHFASKMGQLAGNHFITLTSNLENLPALGKTVLWKGPMGKFEVPAFGEGTQQIMRALAETHRGGAITVAAGGDSVSALNAAGLHGAMTHVSTGGGASLQLLEGESMPGLEALL